MDQLNVNEGKMADSFPSPKAFSNQWVTIFYGVLYVQVPPQRGNMA